MKPTTIPLDSDWTFRKAGEGDWLPAVVPGCVHTDLLANQLIPDPFWGRNEAELQWIEEQDWEYQCTFELSESALAESKLELVAEGLDTVATLYLNGRELGRSENMFVGRRWNIRGSAQAGANTLRIHFHNPMDYIRGREKKALAPCCNDPVGGRYQIRKEQCSFGWDWGPRFATSGVWRPMRIEAYSCPKLDDVHIWQEHARRQVQVHVVVEAPAGAKVRAALYYEGELVAEADGHAGTTISMSVRNPQLWWTNGMGGQPLYEVRVELLDGDEVVGTRRQRMGLCDVRLDRQEDKWGESFQFTVNGRAVFAKGANWIPAHSFVNKGVALYEDLLDSAVEAHMNMIRVWGGGIYELEEFYELCLEKGLLVWQDFMFACALYPGDAKFLGLVEAEAEYQVRRLRNFSNLALWCGNNEIEQMAYIQLRLNLRKRRAYTKVFREILPEAVQRLHPQVAYWPSSAHNPKNWLKDSQNQDSGDAHYWGVWHSREPVEAYEKQLHRFFSEFGMQAYPCPETAATFTESTNVFGEDMDNHQKNGGGNQIIFHYISTLYRFPKDYRSTVYLSQLNQAYCLRFGIEHMRRNMPRTMGALYWQINDCWPVASWSSIDFGGRWKALHYTAKRFFAPALVSVKLLGEETTIWSNNVIRSTVNGAQIWTVCDGPDRAEAVLDWALWSLKRNERVVSGTENVLLVPGKSRQALTVDFGKAIDECGRGDLVLQTRLVSERYPTSRNTTILTAPKRVEFRPAEIRRSVKTAGKGKYRLRLQSDRFAYQVQINLADGTLFRADDNFVDLYPDEVREIVVRVAEGYTQARMEENLALFSYTDSYEP